MTSMQTWVIMITMSKLIRFDDNDLDAYDHDDHEDDYDDVEIPPCPPSHQGESSPAYSCHACNKNQSIVIKMKLHHICLIF